MNSIKLWFIKKLAGLETSVVRMDAANRKARIGFGKNEGKFYFRIDAWFIGYRINQK